MKARRCCVGLWLILCVVASSGCARLGLGSRSGTTEHLPPAIFSSVLVPLNSVGNVVPALRAESDIRFKADALTTSSIVLIVRGRRDPLEKALKKSGEQWGAWSEGGYWTRPESWPTPVALGVYEPKGPATLEDLAAKRVANPKLSHRYYVVLSLSRPLEGGEQRELISTLTPSYGFWIMNGPGDKLFVEDQPAVVLYWRDRLLKRNGETDKNQLIKPGAK